MKVKAEFEKWAKGFSGCDGGNLRGSIWLCGIEWGMGKKHDLKKELKESVSKPPQIYKSADDVLGSPEGGPYRFNVRFLKLVAAMRGLPVDNYKTIAHETPFPFHRKSEFFKLNLYPIAFKKREDEWTTLHVVATGLPTKRAFEHWCRRSRFPAMRRWVSQGRPKLIIASGKYKQEFCEAFGFDDANEHEETIEGKKLTWMALGKTALAVIPYLGYQNGLLNSDELLQAFGERLGEILEDHRS